MGDSSVIHKFDHSIQFSVCRSKLSHLLLLRFYRHFLLLWKRAKSAHSLKQQFHRNFWQMHANWVWVIRPASHLVHWSKCLKLSVMLLCHLRLQKCQGFHNENALSSTPHGDFTGILKYSGWWRLPHDTKQEQVLKIIGIMQSNFALCPLPIAVPRTKPKTYLWETPSPLRVFPIQNFLIYSKQTFSSSYANWQSYYVK